jgi:hypothetical protein
VSDAKNFNFSVAMSPSPPLSLLIDPDRGPQDKEPIREQETRIANLGSSLARRLVEQFHEDEEGKKDQDISTSRCKKGKRKFAPPAPPPSLRSLSPSSAPPSSEIGQLHPLLHSHLLLHRDNCLPALWEKRKKSKKNLNRNDGDEEIQNQTSHLSYPAVLYLRQWFVDHIVHPYASEKQKREICEATQLSANQVTTWLVNQRKRYWQPFISNLAKALNIEPNNPALSFVEHPVTVRCPLSTSSSISPHDLS